ncbi:Por secretion system C-terminal sorting domain-containing protein [Epilithonimonas hungarica]|uniref:Por secretion system C-terminal sorting domain-containing protein n=2 Tax=Epilithonimonas hungarica TaxID=454006 RepID=A0A1G7FE69_9FLAO|nr:Por secretion system C-terminal sorting domain-containing protein [Epilithonimonas hungarica]
MSAQNYGLNENFENESSSPSWSTLDLDGDDKTWKLQSPQDWTTALGFSGYVYVSDSYDSTANQPLNPDNVLVSPTFIYEYPRIKNGNALLGISFKISASDPVRYSETYALYLLPATQTFTGNETPVFFETLDSGTTSKNILVEKWDWDTFGQEVRLYFRHYNSPNQKALVIDDIINYNFTMSTNDVVLKNKTVIFPNPTKRFIQIDLKTETVQNVEVIDISGRKHQVKFKNNKVDLEGLKSGVYFIKINTKLASYINKFIKE